MSNDQALHLIATRTAPVLFPAETTVERPLTPALGTDNFTSKLELGADKDDEKVVPLDVGLSTGNAVAFVNIHGEPGQVVARSYTGDSSSRTSKNIHSAGLRSRSSLQAVPLNRADGSRRSTAILEGEFESPERRIWKWAKWFPGTNRWQIPLKGKKLMVAINAIGGLAILYYGYDQGVMAGVNNTENYRRIMGVNSSPQTARDSAAIGGIVAIYYVGTLIGGLIGGSLADRLGRIRSGSSKSTANRALTYALILSQP